MNYVTQPCTNADAAFLSLQARELNPRSQIFLHFTPHDHKALISNINIQQSNSGKKEVNLYDSNIDKVRGILKGHNSKIIKELNLEMKSYSDKLDFEKTFAFTDFTLERNPVVYEFSNIDTTRKRKILKTEDYFYSQEASSRSLYHLAQDFVSQLDQLFEKKNKVKDSKSRVVRKLCEKMVK